MTKKKLSFLFLLQNVLIIFLSFLVKRKNKWVAFGSWCGETYNDNSKYLLEYLLKEPTYSDYHFFWVGQEHIRTLLPPNVEFIERDTFASAIKLLRCKYYFFCQMARADISRYNVYHGATTCFLDHGIPIKKWAMDVNGYHGELELSKMPLKKKLISLFVGESIKYDYFVASSLMHERTYLSALSYRMATNSKILHSGTPRNDILINYTDDDFKRLKEKYATIFKFDLQTKIVLYLPTFRNNVEQVESFANRNPLEMEKLSEVLLKYNAVLLEKNHFAANKFDINKQTLPCERIIKINIPVDLQELMLISDIQIGDYSGSILDYLLLDKPVIHYLYDYEYYAKFDAGLYYELEEFCAGKTATNFDECLAILEETLQGLDNCIDLRKRMREFHVPFETGRASEIIAEQVLLNKIQ